MANQYVTNHLKCFKMIKRIYDLNFSKDHQFVIYKRLSIFGIFITKKEIAKFIDINDAVKHLKSLI